MAKSTELSSRRRKEKAEAKANEEANLARANNEMIEKKWILLSNDLIKVWIRHQYIKPLIIVIIVIWLFGISFVLQEYQKEVSHFLDNELITYNCSTIHSEKFTSYFDSFTTSCEALDLKTEYYYSKKGYLYKKTVFCSIEGANFKHDEPLTSYLAVNVYLQTAINYLGPIILTYYIIEVLYLGLYDCLIIEPKVVHDEPFKDKLKAFLLCQKLPEKEKKTILQIVPNVYRVGFLIRDCSLDENRDEMFLPGIRIGGKTISKTCLFIIFIYYSVILPAFQKRGIQCTRFQGFVTTDNVLWIFFVMYILYAIWECTNYYSKFLEMDPLEDVVFRYSFHFKEQRFKFTFNQRCFLDALVILYSPILMALAFGALCLVVPFAILFFVIMMINYCITCLKTWFNIEWLPVLDEEEVAAVCLALPGCFFALIMNLALAPLRDYPPIVEDAENESLA